MVKQTKLILEQSERTNLYGGIALINFVSFFVLIMIFTNALNKYVLLIMAVISLIIGYLLFERGVKERRQLEKIKEIEIYRELRNERSKK